MGLSWTGILKKVYGRRALRLVAGVINRERRGRGLLDALRQLVCPLFFRLAQKATLARLCADAQFETLEQHRVASQLPYADADEACSAAFVGGPVALAWSCFGDDVRARVRARYLEAIGAWRHGQAYRVPGEFVVVGGTVPRGLIARRWTWQRERAPEI